MHIVQITKTINLKNDKTGEYSINVIFQKKAGHISLEFFLNPILSKHQLY